MTHLGQQTLRFSGRFKPGDYDAPTIAGSVDADHDNHAEIFVKVDAGASTEFWSIFKLVGGHVVQATVDRQPARVAVGGSVTHTDGFSCAGEQFVMVGESSGSPDFTTWKYERDTFTWQGSTLVMQSKQTGQTTSTDAPAAYQGVSCGDLPQSAPAGATG